MSVEQSKAIKTINPDAEFSIREGVITWVTDPIPSDEIAAKQEELQAEYDSQTYARNRQAEYPSIEECVHAILDDQLDALQVKRQAVKAKYPKP